jgi:hypothetical protein
MGVAFRSYFSISLSAKLSHVDSVAEVAMCPSVIWAIIPFDVAGLLLLLDARGRPQRARVFRSAPSTVITAYIQARCQYILDSWRNIS